MTVSSSLSVLADDGEVVSEAGACSVPSGGSSGAGEGGRKDDRRV